MQTFKQFLNEKSSYELYHNTYSDAVQAAYAMAKKSGWEISDDDIDRIVATNTKKPSSGNTTKFSLPLYKDGKESKKMLHVQVYNRETDSKTYELNTYIS